jgi:hypothetical protein
VAQAGADYMHSNFEFVDPASGEVSKFSDYMRAAASKGTFFSHTVSGSGAKGGKAFSINYKGRDLSGDALKAQMAKWAAYGTVEPDAAAAISRMAEGKVDLRDQHFVLIGAGSAMGPFAKLLEHG